MINNIIINSCLPVTLITTLITSNVYCYDRYYIYYTCYQTR